MRSLPFLPAKRNDSVRIFFDGRIPAPHKNTFFSEKRHEKGSVQKSARLFPAPRILKNRAFSDRLNRRGAGNGGKIAARSGKASQRPSDRGMAQAVPVCLCGRQLSPVGGNCLAAMSASLATCLLGFGSAWRRVPSAMICGLRPAPARDNVP